MFRYDGQAWSEAESAKEGFAFLSVTGSASNDVWAVGIDGFAHHDGDRWTIHDAAALLAGIALVGDAGSSGSEYVAVGYNTAILRLRP